VVRKRLRREGVIVVDEASAIIVGLFCSVWIIVFYIQVFLGYGTAYRYTKRGGDSGIALFGWMIVFSFAAAIPGLGFYLWSKSKNFNQTPGAVATTPPAGWYADPSGEPGKQRYWDGQRWV
jgi:hypothetical protein